jgi:SAM-dependent methyltransferase
VSLLRTPSFIAFLVQCLASICILCFILINSLTIQFNISLIALCALQGTLAAIFTTRWMRDSWWRLINFFFPFMIYGAFSLHLPKELYLAGFLFIACFFWTCFKTQVPFYPSSRAVWERVRESLPNARPLHVMDIGCGLGGLLLNLEKRNSKLKLSGIENAPLPWLISAVRKWLNKSKINFILGDYNSLDFVKYDVIFAYLSPAAMVNLYLKAIMEMRPNTLLISHEFEIPGITPYRILTENESESPTYIYFIYGNA